MPNRKTNTLLACAILTLLSQANCFADDTEVFFGTVYSSRLEEPNVLLVLDTSGSMNDTIPQSRQPYDPTVTYTANSADSSSCNQSPEYVWFTTSGTPTCSSNNKIPLSQFYCSFATTAGGNLASGGTGLYTNYAARWKKTSSTSSSYSWSSNLTSNSSGNTTYYPHITCKNHIQDSNQYPTSSTTSTDSNKWIGSSSNNYWSNNTGTSATFYSQNYVKYLNDSTQIIPETTKMAAMKQAATEVISSLNNMNVGLMTYDTNGSGGFVRREIAPIDDEGQRTISFSGRTSSCSTSTNNNYVTTNCTLSIQTQPTSGSIAIGQVITGPSSLQCAFIKTGSGNTWTMTKTLSGSSATLSATSQTTVTASSKMTDIINCFIPNGSTPLTETLYEAYKYFSGGSLTYGNNSSPHYSVAKSRTNQTMSSSTYDSPMDNTCQNNYLVYLTDGMPTSDTGADSSIWSLTGTNTNTCHGDTFPAFGCAGVLSKYMYENDLRTSINGKQNVSTSFIAFGADVAQSTFESAANAAGGDAFGASDYDQLSSVFRTVFNNVLDTNSTFTSPSIAVNAFNKTQVLEDMYVAMFKPETTTHWDGNLKKFKLRNNQIVGRGATLDSVDTANAVGGDGFFTNTTKDFWEALNANNTDLNITTKGGAANKIPAPTSRNVYTYIASNRPSSFSSLSSHPFSISNTAITDALLGTSTNCTNTTTTDTPCRNALINFLRGDNDGNLSTTTDTRHIMGDAVHSQPAVVIYGNGSCAVNDTADQCEIKNLNDAVVFVATNDGFLHAIRPYSDTDSNNGEELWSFIPQEILPDLINVYRDNPLSSSNAKHYSLDGDIRVLKYDINSDGKVDASAGDRVFIYFSQGRGGDNYYALDVTNKDDPKFMWSLDRTNNSPNNLPVVSKSWSAPTLGRVNISGATQNPQKLVLIFGGGYDDDEDSIDYRSSDSYGNAVYMIDAVKGTVLWSQTKTSSGAFARMTHAIPSNVTVLDTDNNGYSDRMYVGDMAGQLWRFDISNGNTAASLVTGGVIASLGAKEVTSGSETTLRRNNRTFYNAPDVSMITASSGSNYYNIAIGSGDRARPKSNTTTEDYFFSIRDFNLSAMSQSYYNSLASDPLKIDDLELINGQIDKTADITSGWKLALDTSLHEKSIAQSATVAGTVMFTTFISNTSVDSCTATTGYNRTYTVKLSSGMKYFTDPDEAITTDGNGLYEQFNTTGLPSQINIVNMGNIKKTIPNEEATSTKTKTGTCLSGVTILDSCVEFGSRIKAFWKDTGSN